MEPAQRILSRYSPNKLFEFPFIYLISSSNQSNEAISLPLSSRGEFVDGLLSSKPEGRGFETR
jgi:hypothetical protein